MNTLLINFLFKRLLRMHFSSAAINDCNELNKCRGLKQKLHYALYLIVVFLCTLKSALLTSAKPGNTHSTES